MERTDFFNKVLLDGVQEYDHLYNNLSKFRMYYPVQYYRVAEDDLMRPDLISFKKYSTISYWWIICYVNDIEDAFHDLEVGMLLIIPNPIDIYSFYKKYRIS